MTLLLTLLLACGSPEAPTQTTPAAPEPTEPAKSVKPAAGEAIGTIEGKPVVVASAYASTYTNNKGHDRLDLTVYTVPVTCEEHLNTNLRLPKTEGTLYAKFSVPAEQNTFKLGTFGDNPMTGNAGITRGKNGGIGGTLTVSELTDTTATARFEGTGMNREFKGEVQFTVCSRDKK